MGDTTETLGDALPKEMARVRDEVMPAYIKIGIDLASGPDYTVVECLKCRRIHSFTSPVPARCPRCRSHYNWAGLSVVRSAATPSRVDRWEAFRAMLLSGKRLQFVSHPNEKGQK